VLDVLIAGGQIIDGSGNIAFLGALGIAGETVHILRGDVLAVEAARVVDASGRSVLGGINAVRTPLDQGQSASARA
jgi:N-acyl-D-aspartate/D-glutamate deacylase